MDRSRLPKFVKNATPIKLGNKDTKPGAVDDDAKKRIKKRNQMLKDAAGN